MSVEWMRGFVLWCMALNYAVLLIWFFVFRFAQLLITRGALTTFSLANDLAKYFAIVPAMFAATLPWLDAVDIMHLHSATSAVLSAVIFNALIIPALIPIALKAVSYQPLGANALLRRNLVIWGLGGIIAPFVGIKVIDLFLQLVAVVLGPWVLG